MSVQLGWRAALGGWSLLALVALPVAGLVLVRAGRDLPGGGARAESASHGGPLGALRHSVLARSRTARAMTVLFGVQALHAYVQFGWVPQIFRDAGLSPTTASALLSLITGLGVVGSIVIPTAIARPRAVTLVVSILCALLVTGYAGVLVAPTSAPWLWAVLLGIAGFLFPAALSLISLRTRDAAVTARVSGVVQPVGYLLAAVGPLAVGLIHQVTGGWTVVLVMLMVLVLPMLWCGWALGRPGVVDDELEGSYA